MFLNSVYFFLLILIITGTEFPLCFVLQKNLLFRVFSLSESEQDLMGILYLLKLQ